MVYDSAILKKSCNGNRGDSGRGTPPNLSGSLLVLFLIGASIHKNSSDCGPGACVVYECALLNKNCNKNRGDSAPGTPGGL